MKRFNINPKEREFSWGKMLVVELGEEGRGRWLELVPYHAPKDAQYLEIGKTRSGKIKIVKGDSADGKWLAAIYTYYTYTRDTFGYASVLESQIDKVDILTTGEGAFGAAGRIGGWQDYLLVIEDGTLIKVEPSGNSWYKHKVDDYYLYFSEKKVYRIEENEIEIFADTNGIDITCGFTSFVDVIYRKKNGK